jgi:hypothetical protein
MNPPHPSPEEIFHRLLDESSALLAAPEGAGIAVPDDELHREIIVPLLPAMLADAAIRGHWSEQAATGFVARIGRHFENGEPAPRWTPGDFEIHVTASYSAGADARALADTLLSEESLRDMTAMLMNQLLDAVWPSLATVPSAAPAEPQPAIEIPAAETPALETAMPAQAPIAEEIPPPVVPTEPEPEPAVPIATAPEPSVEAAPQILPSAIPPSAIEPERAEEIQPAEFLATHQASSRALIRTLCRKLASSVVQRGLLVNSKPDSSTAIVARRILQRAACCAPFGPRNRRPHIAAPRATSPRRLPRRASL